MERKPHPVTDRVRRHRHRLRTQHGVARVEVAVPAARAGELRAYARALRGGAPENRGPFASADAALEAITGRLAACLDPEAIYLFGSRARGGARPDSDFDLLVVFADAAGDRGRDHDRAYAPLAGLGVGCDVVPALVSDVAADLAVAGTIGAEAVVRGREVYRRPGVALPWTRPRA